jgi:hypothetical protein
LRGVSKVLNDEQPENKIPIAHSGCVKNSFTPCSTKKYFVWSPVFLIFSKKLKKQATKHYFISPPEAAKYFLHNALWQKMDSLAG